VDYATRLWPITKTKAKPLLPIGKKKIIDHVYEKLRKFNIPIIVSTNKLFKDDFERWAEDKDVELVIENSTREEEKLGAVRALAEVAKAIDDEMIVIAGDNIFSFDLNDFVEYYKKRNAPVAALYDVGDYELAKRYGVAELEGERIVNIQEKPDKPKSTVIVIGVYALPHYAVEMLLDYVRLNEKHDNLGDFLSWLCGKTDVYGYPFTDGSWYDIGNPDSYIDALKSYMDSYVAEDVEVAKTSKIIPPVVIEEGTRIEGRSIVGPYVYVGRNCEIVNSDISDSIIFGEVTLKRARIWRSIIDERCEIRNLELSSSIVGGHAKIQGGD